MAGARSRKGLSAPLVGVFGALALVMCLSLYALAAARLVEAFYAASGNAAIVASGAKKRLDARIALEQVVEGNEIKNYSAIILANTWPDDVHVDYIVVLGKDGGILGEKSFAAAPLLLRPGESARLYFADISASLSAYDQDFWLAKRRVAAVMAYARGGVAAYSCYLTSSPIDVAQCNVTVKEIGEEPVVAYSCP
ncbi:MAG: hypothetical protein QXL31_05865 [Thermosphaera sp.]